MLSQWERLRLVFELSIYSIRSKLGISKAYFSLLLIILTCFTGLMAFQRLLLLEYEGGPEKDRDVCFCGGTSLRMFSLDSSCQQDVPWHDGNSPGVDGTQVGIIKQPDKVCLRRFLETQYRR